MSFYIDTHGLLRFRPWAEIPWLTHGFTTRTAGDFSSPELDSSFLARWELQEMFFQSVRQIHSDRLHVLEDGAARRESGLRPEADGLMTQASGWLLGVRIADCLPILLVSRQARAVAAVHAGWRGSAQKIAVRAVEDLHKRWGCTPQSLEVVIGPGIGRCCYEVGPEVAEQFETTHLVVNRRIHLDLAAANQGQLEQAGVPRRQIHAARMCTRCDQERFHSHRREGPKAGRMLGLIGIRGNPACGNLHLGR